MPEPMVDPYLSGVIEDLNKQEVQSQQLYTSLSNGVTQDPAAATSHQRIARTLGTTPDTVRVDPKRYEAVAKMRGFDANTFSNQWPITTSLMSNPDVAAAAHDDLETYKAAEDQFKAAENKGWLTGWTPSQRSALAESLISQADANKGKDQITSAAANLNRAFVSPFLSFVGSLAKAPEEMLTKAFGLQTNPADPSIGGVVDSVSKAFDDWTGASIKQGAQPQLWDPQQKKWFANPLYGHGGQNLVNELASMPGTLAAMVAGGEFTAPVMAFNAGYERFKDTYAKSGSAWKALTEGFGSGAANLALLTKMPAPVPKATLAGTIATQTARAVPLAGGMTIIDNALRQLHEPDGDLTKDFTRQLITFALFENVHSVNVAVGKAGEAYQNYKFMSDLKGAVENSKLFERDPQLFAEHLDKMGEGKDVSIDARTWTRYWQLQGEDPAAKAEAFGVSPEHYSEANATSNEMFIPVSRFLTETAKSPHFDELAKDIRLKPGGVTMRESEAMAQQLESEVNLAQAELQKMAAKDQSEHPDYQKLVDDFKVQAIGAGGDTARTANESAKLFANVAINLADKASTATNKVSPLDIAKRLVVGPAKVDQGGPNGVSTQSDAGLAGGGTPEGPSRLRQDQAVGSALGAGGRPTDARAVFQRLGDIHNEIAAAELPGQTARVLDPIRFDSRDHGQREYTREVEGRRIRVTDTRYEGDPRGRGGIDVSVLQNGDIYVNHIFNADVVGAGKFLYDQAVQLALQNFPEVGKDSHLIGSTSEDAIASRLSYNGTDVYRPETDGISWVGGITSTRVQDVLNHGRPVDLLGPDGGVTRLNQPTAFAPIFYSALQRTVPDLSKIADKGGMVSPDQAKSWLAARQKEGKFKQAELDAVGLPEWLDLQKGKVSVDDIKAFVEQNGVQIQEVMKGEPVTASIEEQDGKFVVSILDGKVYGRYSDLRDAEAAKLRAESQTKEGPARYSEYQLPGGENYRELLLTLPRGTASKRFEVQGQGPAAKLYDIERGQVVRQGYYGDMVDEAAKRNAELVGSVPPFRSSHWDESNILSHIRFNERTDAEGRKVLFIEEIQSDWGQKGKKEGFADPVLSKYIVTGDHGVPTAPFVTDTKAWVALSIKRMIRYAAENGFERVAFVNGEQSADRYDLSKQVSRVVWSERSNTLSAYDLSGNKVIDQRGVEAKDLEGYIGKEAAQKLVDTEPTNIGIHQLDAEGLKVGGEGMRAFYDKIVPSVAGEVLKKLGGGKVSPTKMEAGSGFEVVLPSGKVVNTTDTRKKAEATAKSFDGATVREVGGTDQLGFDITPEMRDKVLGEGQALFQPNAQGPRGFLEFGAGGETFRIGITENQNKSTIFHELTHFFVEMTNKLASDQGAGEEIVKLNDDLRKWVGAEDGKPLTETQHEKLADGMLLYLAEGKAPDPELKSSFRKIASWFGKIGQQLISADVKLDPEVRGIFDRMIASDKAIDEAKMLMGDASPLFVTAAAMGVTEKEFQLYLAAKQKDIDAAKEDLRNQLMRQLQREHAQEWRDQLAATREKVAAELDAMPEYKALKALTSGELEDGTPIKLSREALVEKYGAERLKELGRSRDLVYSATEGMDAEAAALLLGFSSGDELVNALTGLEARGKRINRESIERMKAEHGDLLTDPQAFREASLVAYNEQREDVLARELKALNKLKRTAEGVTKVQSTDATKAEEHARKVAAADVPNMQAARIAASAFVGNTPLFRTDPNRYRQTAEKASREAFDKQGKGDYAGAVEAKRTEILNHFMFLEAQRALKLGDSTLAFAKQLQTPRTYGNLGKAGGTFQQQVDQILERFEFKKGTNQQLADRETLAQWVEKMTADNEEAVVPEWIQNELLRTNYRQLTNNQVQDVLDTLKNIKHLAYRQLRVDTGVRKVEFADLLTEMDDRARSNNKSTPLPLPDSTVPAKQKVINWLRGKDAALVKMEQMVNWLDGNDVNGPWHEAIWNPIARAQTADYDKIVEINQKLQAHLEQMPRKQQDSMLDEFIVPGFEHKLNRKQIITMLFNTGTAANKAKLIGGYVKEGLNEEVLNAAFKNLNQHDTAFVQGVWDTIGELWPEIAALQKRMSGIEPKREEVTPVTVTLSDGTTQELRGGYFPLVAAAGRSTVAGKQESSATALFDYGGGYTKAATSTGHTKERTGAIYPLSLDFTPTITQHTTQVIKDLTHREAVVLANRILTSPKVRTTLAEVMGEDYRDQFMPWLRNIVNDRNGAASQAASKWQTFATSSRANLVAAVLGFKYSSIIVQLTDATRVVGPGEYRVPVGKFLGAVKDRYLHPYKTAEELRAAGGLPAVPEDKFTYAFLDYLQNPSETVKAVHELSGEMRHRPENLDRDLRPQWERLRGDASWKAEWNRKAFKGLGFMDALISVPAWVGAYRHAMDKGETSDNAVLIADRTVRLSLMAGNPKDLLGVQRDPDKFMKLVTMFMGDGPAQYNLLRNAGHKMEGLSGIGTFTGTAIAVSMANIIGDYLKGQKPADGEDKRKWAVRKALLAWSQPIPIIRDVANAVDGKLAGKPFSDYRLSPVVTVGQKVVDGIHRVQMLAEGTEKPPDFAIHALDTIGTVFGVGGTSQFVASAKYLRRVQTGEEKPANTMELIGNTIQGKPKEMKR